MTEKNISPKYYLGRGALRSRAILEITPEREQELAKAWARLRLVADLEESWDAVVRNYIELEQVLLETALHDMVVSGKDFFLSKKQGFRSQSSLQVCSVAAEHIWITRLITYANWKMIPNGMSTE